MALVRTDVGSWISATTYGTAAFTTGSFTPPANSILVISLTRMTNFGSGNPGALSSITDNLGSHLTYTPQSNASLAAAWSARLDVYTALVGASPSAMTISVDDANNIYAWDVSVVAFTGYNATTPIAGIVTSGTTDIADGAETQTLAATPTTNDVTMAFIYVDADNKPSNPTLTVGWTLVYDIGNTGGGNLSVIRRESSTSTSVAVTDVYTAPLTCYKAAMLSLIVKAAAAATNNQRRSVVGNAILSLTIPPSPDGTIS